VCQENYRWNRTGQGKMLYDVSRESRKYLPLRELGNVRAERARTDQKAERYKKGAFLAIRQLKKPERIHKFQRVLQGKKSSR